MARVLKLEISHNKFHYSRWMVYYGVFFVCLCFLQITECSEKSNTQVLTASLHASVNISNNDEIKSSEQQKVSKVLIDVIRTKLWDGNIYVRQVQFTSFGISFKLFLRRKFLLDSKMHLNVGGQSLGIGVSNLTKYLPVLYVGVMDNFSNSGVHGRITDKTFEVFFQRGNSTFSVECPFHKFEGTWKKHDALRHHLYNCSASRLHSARVSHLKSHISNCLTQSKKYKDFLSEALPVNVDMVKDEHIRKLHKRSTSSVSGVCVLHLMADHLYFQKVGGSDIKKSIAEMLVALAEADSIFRQTDFNGDGTADDIGFKVGNITIFRETQSYNMKSSSTNSFVYISQLAAYDFSNYCLGIAFTYKKFDEGVIGLAWLGSSNLEGPVGGICQKRYWHYSVKKYTSYNTALVTHNNYNNLISSLRAGLVLAHEFGHSFGSPHDAEPSSYKTKCSPGAPDGYYLMTPGKWSAHLPNDRKFSPCSIESINPVLTKKGPLCFKEDFGSVCGNAIVEEGEECDCGTADICSEVDVCCTPFYSSQEFSDPPCTVRRSLYQCSPKSEVCCTDSCMPYDSSSSIVCAQMTECAEASTCQSGMATCPHPVPKPEGTLCDSGRKVCSGGQCSKSICTSLGLTECQCTSSIAEGCYICCMPVTVTNFGCSPINTFSCNIENMYRLNGDRCFENKGFCDESGQCILQEFSVVDGLKQLPSKETEVNIGVWMTKYWFYIIAGIIGAAFLATIITLFFKPKQGVHTDALRMGKLAAIIAKAQQQRDVFRDKIEECEVVFENMKSQYECSMPLSRAVVRLSVLFPTAPISLLTKSVQSSSSEVFAVKMLLVRNFPMQKFSVSLNENDSDTTQI